MLDTLGDSLVIRSLGWALLQFIWQGCVVALLTAATLGLLHRHAAATRYLVATGGLFVMFLFPVATAVGHVRLGSTTTLGVAAMAPPYFTTVVSQIAVAGQVLHVFERHVLERRSVTTKTTRKECVTE